MHLKRRKAPRGGHKIDWTKTDGQRLREWRIKTLTIGQEELAREAGIGRASVSAYERGDRTPDAHTLILLSALAAGLGHFDIAVWLLQKSGLMEMPLRLTHDGISKEFLRPEGTSLVRVPPTEKAGIKAQGESSDLLLPPRFVQHVGLTSHIIAEDGDTGEPFGPGDIFVLDESFNQSATLGPFWNKLVLLKAETEEASINISRLRWLVGKLRLRRAAAGPVFTWQITFHPWATVELLHPYAVGIFVDDSAIVGLGREYRGWKSPGAMREGMEHVERRSKDRAEQNAKIGEGFRILGVVTAVIRAL